MKVEIELSKFVKTCLERNGLEYRFFYRDVSPFPFCCAFGDCPYQRESGKAIKYCNYYGEHK